jgi:hypothetical protein
MQISVSVVSDYASQSDGKLNVLGIFQLVNVQRQPLPVVLPIFYFVIQIGLAPEEYDLDYPTTIRIEKPDGSVELLATTTVSVSSKGIQVPEAGANTIIAVPIVGYRFEMSGDYVFQCDISGAAMATSVVTALPETTKGVVNDS